MPVLLSNQSITIDTIKYLFIQQHDHNVCYSLPSTKERLFLSKEKGGSLSRIRTIPYGL